MCNTFDVCIREKCKNSETGTWRRAVLLDSIRWLFSSSHVCCVVLWMDPCCGPRSLTAAFSSSHLLPLAPFFSAKERSHMTLFWLRGVIRTLPFFFSCSTPYPILIITNRLLGRCVDLSLSEFALLVAHSVFVWRPAWFFLVSWELALSVYYCSADFFVGVCVFVDLGYWSKSVKNHSYI